MDIINILLFCLMSCVIGAVLMLLIQYYAFVRYFDASGQTGSSNNNQNQRFELPDEVLLNLKSPDPETKTPITAINLVMQFLFHELRHRNDVRKWFYRKLSLELDELLTKTTTGKLFDKLSIRELDIGGQFPEIKNLRVHNAELHDTEGHIENVDLILNLQYSGNFRIAIDVDMVLGKKGSLSVIVKHVSGLARLQFTRKPYTHWSLSFVGDPQIDLGVDSQFQGRQMQSNVTSLISNQIRKAIRRKHTLPNYKLRYKPFFHKTEEDLDGEVIPDGRLEVHILQTSRLMLAHHQNITHIYCTITLSSIPWVTARNYEPNKSMVLSLLVEIHKTKNQQIGIVFKQIENTVIVEAILPNTPAAKANLHRNDVLYSVEGKRVTHINHVAKIIKGITKPMFMLRIERVVPGGIVSDKPDKIPVITPVEEKETYENIDRISFSKVNDSVQMLGAKSPASPSSSSGRGTEKTLSRESSLTNTPSKASSANILARSKSKSLTRNDSESDSMSITRSGDSPQHKRSIARINSGEDQRKTEEIEEVEQFIQHVSREFQFNQLIHVEDSSQFDLNENSKFINLNIYGRSDEGTEDFLLGYTNIPIAMVLSECSESNLRNFLKNISLMPPDTPNLTNFSLSSQSGFDPNQCYGDILLSFVWSGSPSGLFYADSNSVRKSKREPIDVLPTKQHDFIRKHFNRTTQCDFCGKKIWLKDAVQCKDCSMCCHKKCITKCQNSTVCGSVDSAPSSFSVNPEFKVTEALEIGGEAVEDVVPEPKPTDGHRQSLGDFLAQGLKRVNSASNLAVPGIVSSLGQGTRSLPPSPQHSPRKQSLTNPSNNPFAMVTQRLEAILEDGGTEMQESDITKITEPLIGWGSADEMMSLAKSASHYLYADVEAIDRVEKINGLLSKLRLALDSETANHADLMADSNSLRQTQQKEKPSISSVDTLNLSSDSTLLLQTKAPNSTQEKDVKPKDVDLETKIAKLAFLLGQSEERVQALSIIMLHLCSGLQHAQGIANQ